MFYDRNYEKEKYNAMKHTTIDCGPNKFALDFLQIVTFYYYVKQALSLADWMSGVPRIIYLYTWNTRNTRREMKTREEEEEKKNGV